MSNIYETIIGNPELNILKTQILGHLEEKFGKDVYKQQTALIATMSHGFNELFTTLPNIIITAEIFKEITADNDDETVVNVGKNMTNFIEEICKNVDNDKILILTELVKNLTTELAEKEKEEGLNENTIDSKDN